MGGGGGGGGGLCTDRTRNHIRTRLLPNAYSSITHLGVRRALSTYYAVRAYSCIPAYSRTRFGVRHLVGLVLLYTRIHELTYSYTYIGVRLREAVRLAGLVLRREVLAVLTTDDLVVVATLRHRQRRVELDDGPDGGGKKAAFVVDEQGTLASGNERRSGTTVTGCTGIRKRNHYC